MCCGTAQCHAAQGLAPGEPCPWCTRPKATLTTKPCPTCGVGRIAVEAVPPGTADGARRSG